MQEASVVFHNEFIIILYSLAAISLCRRCEDVLHSCPIAFESLTQAICATVPSRPPA